MTASSPQRPVLQTLLDAWGLPPALDEEDDDDDEDDEEEEDEDEDAPAQPWGVFFGLVGSSGGSSAVGAFFSVPSPHPSPSTSLMFTSCPWFSLRRLAVLIGTGTAATLASGTSARRRPPPRLVMRPTPMPT